MFVSLHGCLSLPIFFFEIQISCSQHFLRLSRICTNNVCCPIPISVLFVYLFIDKMRASHLFNVRSA